MLWTCEIQDAQYMISRKKLSSSSLPGLKGLWVLLEDFYISALICLLYVCESRRKFDFRSEVNWGLSPHLHSFALWVNWTERWFNCLSWNSCSLTECLSLVLFTRWDVLLYLVCILGLLFLFLSYFFVFSFGHFSNWYWRCQRLRARILVALACRWPWKIHCCTQWLKKKKEKKNHWYPEYNILETRVRKAINLFFYWLL